MNGLGGGGGGYWVMVQEGGAGVGLVHYILLNTSLPNENNNTQQTLRG